MTHDFRRIGELKDVASYPVWLQRVVADTRRPTVRRVRPSPQFAVSLITATEWPASAAS